jgi:hypothetical protein
MNRFTQSRWPPTKKRRPSVRPQLELLEARNLLDGSTPTNVLVNNPAEDTTNHDTQSETAIVLGANSNVVVAFNDDGGASPSYLQLGGYSLSTNGGTSFTDEGNFPIGPYPYAGGVDPGLARSNKTGTIFLSSLTANLALFIDAGQVNVFRSTDNGATFNLPVSGTPGFVDGVDQADKPWIAVDNTPGPAGSGYGNVYLVWTDFLFQKNGSLTNNGIFLTRSTDDGQDWGPSGGVPIVTSAIDKNETVQGGFVTVGPDHAVYVFYWGYGYQSGGETELMRKSTDGGFTFGPQVIVANLKTNGGNGDLGLKNSSNQTFRSNAFPQAAVNTANGDIYVAFDDNGQGSDRADVYFDESTDGGNTWSSPLRVHDDNTKNDQWQPAITVTPDGSHVGIFWYDRRLDPADNLIDRFGVIGTVSGHSVNFSPNFRITNVSFPPAFDQDPFWVRASPTYMGDYDMATADNNYFYTTWGDNRLSDQFFANQPDVRFAKIPVAGLEDSAVATTSTAPTSGTVTLSATATRFVGSTLTATPSLGTLSSAELGIFNPASAASVLVGSLPTASLGLPNSAGSLPTDIQTAEVSKTSEVLPGSAVGDNQNLPATPLVCHSIHAEPDSLLPALGDDLVSAVIAESLATTLVH